MASQANELAAIVARIRLIEEAEDRESSHRDETPKDAVVTIKGEPLFFDLLDRPMSMEDLGINIGWMSLADTVINYMDRSKPVPSSHGTVIYQEFYASYGSGKYNTVEFINSSSTNPRATLKLAEACYSNEQELHWPLYVPDALSSGLLDYTSDGYFFLFSYPYKTVSGAVPCKSPEILRKIIGSIMRLVKFALQKETYLAWRMRQVVVYDKCMKDDNLVWISFSIKELHTKCDPSAYIIYKLFCELINSRVEKLLRYNEKLLKALRVFELIAEKNGMTGIWQSTPCRALKKTKGLEYRGGAVYNLSDRFNVSSLMDNRNCFERNISKGSRGLYPPVCPFGYYGPGTTDPIWQYEDPEGKIKTYDDYRVDHPGTNYNTGALPYPVASRLLYEGKSPYNPCFESATDEFERLMGPSIPRPTRMGCPLYRRERRVIDTDKSSGTPRYEDDVLPEYETKFKPSVKNLYLIKDRISIGAEGKEGGTGWD